MKKLLLTAAVLLSGACVSERFTAPVAPGAPLVIVDGKEMPDATTQSLNSLNIESVEVIKGPIAQSKYGMHAQNGVILVKTRGR
jgi:TonB-dependent SusC/RagA subfamily outer membrane receptor